MKKIVIETKVKKMLADLYTPVGIYLRVRDRFRDTILLESTDHHVAENSYSFICINAIAGMEITSTKSIEFKLPNEKPERVAVNDVQQVPQQLWNFMQRFDIAESIEKETKFAQGLYGYATYDAVQFFDTIELSKEDSREQNAEPESNFETGDEGHASIIVVLDETADGVRHG